MTQPTSHLSVALQPLTSVPLLFFPEPFTLVETTVVDMRKSFQKNKKAVLSIMDVGPKDETTAFFPPPNHNVVYIFYFSFFFLNESTAIYLLPYCCTVKSSWSEQTGGFRELIVSVRRALVCVHEENSFPSQIPTWMPVFIMIS